MNALTQSKKSLFRTALALFALALLLAFVFAIHAHAQDAPTNAVTVNGYVVNESNTPPIGDPIIPDPTGVVTPPAQSTFMSLLEAVMAVVTAIIFLARIIVKITPTPDDDTKLDSIISFLKHIGLHISMVLLLGMLAIGFTGCKQSQLEQGGAYSPGITSYVTNADSTVSTNFTATAAPDLAFYAVDSSFDLAYTTADAAFSIERKNRAFLWKISPQIKKTCDQLRPQFWSYVGKYTAARDVYKSNPSPPNLTTLQTLYNQVKATADAVTAAVVVPVSVTSTNQP